MSFVFLDIETTGLNVEQGHRVIELAAIEYDEYRQPTNNGFYKLINPERSIETEAIEIHGIRNSDLNEKPKFAEIAEDFASFVQGKHLYAHNAPFDLGFLDAEMKRLKKPTVTQLAKEVTDTLIQAREKFPGQRNSLDALATRLGMEVTERRKVHSAMEDAKILAEAYFLMNSGQYSLDIQSQPEAVIIEKVEQEIEIVILNKSKKARQQEHKQFMQQLKEFAN